MVSLYVPNFKYASLPRTFELTVQIFSLYVLAFLIENSRNSKGWVKAAFVKICVSRFQQHDRIYQLEMELVGIITMLSLLSHLFRQWFILRS